MKPKRIILVRHGQSLGNAEPGHYETIPDYALHLTEQGKVEAVNAGEQVANLIGNETIRAYVSPWHRARETFEGISSILGDQIVRQIEDPRIREQDWGHLATVEQLRNIKQKQVEYGSFYFRLPDGESGADVYDRVSTFLETLHRDFAKPDFPDNAMIVTHGMPLRIFLMRWFHWSVEYFERVRNPRNGEVFVMTLAEDGRYKLEAGLRLRE